MKSPTTQLIARLSEFRGEIDAILAQYDKGDYDEPAVINALRDLRDRDNEKAAHEMATTTLKSWAESLPTKDCRMCGAKSVFSVCGRCSDLLDRIG